MSARIVVAEDEEHIRRLIVFTLRRRGYEVIEATDGAEALEVIRREHPDLILLDAMMPGMGGLQVAATLASDPATATIPWIMASAKGQAAEIAEGLNSGAAAYIVKPFAPQELSARVAEVLAQAGAA